jgi:hypothetical protein
MKKAQHFAELLIVLVQDLELRPPAGRYEPDELEKWYVFQLEI